MNARSYRRFMVCAYAALLVVFTLGTLQHELYDDAYFFKRIALNALEHGSLAWNVSDGPVYGSTSQLFQALVVGITAVAQNHTLLAVRFVSTLCLLAGFSALLSITLRRDQESATSFAFCSPIALVTSLSGMETSFVLFELAALLWLLYSERGKSRRWIWAPALIVCIWLTRPDAILLALGALFAARWISPKRAPLRELLVVTLGVAAFLILFKLYYGTALPLPFYAKQLAFTPYDAEFLRASASAQRVRFALFSSAGLPLFLSAALRHDRTNLVLLGSAIAFLGFHLLTTVDVMGMHGRFYVPALPLLAFAAARAFETEQRRKALLVLAISYFALGAAAALFGGFPVSTAFRGEGLPVAAYLYAVLSAALLLAALGSTRFRPSASRTLFVLSFAAVLVSVPPRFRALPDDDAYLSWHTARVTVFRGLDQLLACFGDGIRVYHSEIGVPGLRFAHGTVRDLAGLMSPEFLFGHQRFDALCLEERPEAIFLPHRNYRALNAEVLHSRCIRSYRVVVSDSSSPLYVRKDLYSRYRACEQTPH